MKVADCAFVVGASGFFATLGWIIYLRFSDGTDMTAPRFVITYWREYVVLLASLALLLVSSPWEAKP